MSLVLDRVRFSWPDGREAVAGASLELSPGGSLALLGPNGAGKSTLLGLAAGRHAPSDGKAELDGRALRDIDPRARARRIAVLPQFERLPFNYGCLDLVLLGRAPHLPALSLPGPADEERALDALGRLGLEAFADRPLDSLSGGELQLVRIARCLAQEADYLLLDEPGSMLDPANARLVADALRGIAASGTAVLFSSHDAAFAAHAATGALLMRGGSVVASGPSRAVLVPELLEAAFGLPFLPATFPSVYGDR